MLKSPIERGTFVVTMFNLFSSPLPIIYGLWSVVRIGESKKKNLIPKPCIDGLWVVTPNEGLANRHRWLEIFEWIRQYLLTVLIHFWLFLWTLQFRIENHSWLWWHTLWVLRRVVGRCGIAFSLLQWLSLELLAIFPSHQTLWIN